MKPNIDIRILIKESGFCAWEVARKMGIHDNTYYRLLRKELTEEERTRIFDAIAELKADREKKFSQIM